MKKILTAVCMLALAGICFAKAPFQPGTKIYINTKNASLRKTESPAAEEITRLSYGTIVSVIESKEKRTLVSVTSRPELQGWIANGSLIKKMPSSEVETSSEEIDQAEKEFAETEIALGLNEETSYGILDRLEEQNEPIDQLRLFIEEGRLHGFEGE